MADEAITDSDQCQTGVLNPDPHDQWFWGLAEPTAPASSPATNLLATVVVGSSGQQPMT